jgi:hypothetical protein
VITLLTDHGPLDISFIPEGTTGYSDPASRPVTLAVGDHPRRPQRPRPEEGDLQDKANHPDDDLGKRPFCFGPARRGTVFGKSPILL